MISQKSLRYAKNGKMLFWAEGTTRRTYDRYRKRWTLSQNSYSSHSYYFITEGEAPLTVEKLPAVTADNKTPRTTVPYAVTLDTDEAGFYEGGRRFFDSHDFALWQLSQLQKSMSSI